MCWRALVGDKLVVESMSFGEPGRLLVLSTIDGRGQTIALPAPEDPLLTVAPGSFWADPLRPGGLLVAYTHQHVYFNGYDFFLVAIFDEFLARLDLESGTWQTLRHSSSSTLDPPMYPLGVTSDGQWILRMVLDSGATLFGALDTETGELSVSGSLCLDQHEHPGSWVVIDDTIYDTEVVGETEVWTPHRIGL